MDSVFDFYIHSVIVYCSRNPNFEFKHDVLKNYFKLIDFITSKGATCVIVSSQANLESDLTEAQWVRL